MGFSNQERINLNSKALQAGVLDGNAAAVWYETFFPFSFQLDGDLVLTDLTTLRGLPAGNLATAQANASANPTLIQDKSANANAVRLTLVAGTNQTTYAAYSTYNDTTSAVLRNWLLPQLVPQNSGAPSNGYAIRLFNGNPASGGTEITTTDGGSGSGVNKTVGWVWNYAGGLLLLASDFFSATGINAGTFDPYVLGFRYIGSTATSGGSGPSEATGTQFNAVAGETIALGEPVRFDTSINPGRVLKAQADSAGNGAVVGIAKGAATVGQTISIATSGSAQFAFSAAPAAADNGKKVYLDAGNAGKATLTAPSASGNVVFELGFLTGGNGATSTPSGQVALDLRYVHG